MSLRINTVPVTGASPIRNSNSVRTDRGSFLGHID